MSGSNAYATHDDNKFRSQTAIQNERPASLFIDRGEIPTNNSPIKMKVFDGEMFPDNSSPKSSLNTSCFKGSRNSRKRNRSVMTGYNTFY